MADLIDIIPPTNCPSCNTPLVERDEGGTGIMQSYCESPHCPGVLEGYLAFVGSRDVLEIDGLGPEMARKLVEKGYARNLVELYEFQAEMQVQRKAMGDKEFVDKARKMGFDATLPKMIRSLEAAKTRSWERWIKALAIPMIGETLGKVIAEKLDLKADSFSLLVSTGLIPFTHQEVDGFGEAKMKAIADWCTAENNALCLKLHQLGVRPTPVEKPKVVAGAPLAGVVFCITGEFSEERIPLTKKLVSLGATAKTGVSKNINLLIVGSGAGKSKLTKAAELGIKQVGKDWLEKMLADNGLIMKQDSFAAEEA
jgi:DNA ligase (NAD+)